MDLETLKEFISYEHDRILKLYDVKDPKALRNQMVIKIMEELGELSEQVLAADGLQRPDKLKNWKHESEKEVADVLITTLILAKNMDLDIGKILKDGMEKRKGRTY